MIEETPVPENNEQETQDASIQPVTQGGVLGKEQPIEEAAASAIGQTTAPVLPESPLSERIEHAFEAFRSRLVNLIGDIPGIHNVVDDAKEAIKPHVAQEKSND